MIKRVWHTITHIGVTEALDSREARRVSYVNYCALVVIAYATIRGFISLSNMSYSLKLFCMTIPTVFVIFLNHYHFYTTAKVFLFAFSMTAVTSFTYFFLGGFNGGAYVLLLTGVPLAFMLFDIRQKIHIFVSLGYLFSCLAILIILQNVHPLPNPSQLNLDVIRISVTVLTVLVLLLLTWYFHSSNAIVEEKLVKEKEKSEAANLAKSEFLANMSHELRTPLNAILGFSQLMTRDSDISSEQLGHLETIGRSGEHLLSLINDVLEFSKIEAGRIDLNKENFDFHRLLLGLEEMFRLRGQQKGLSLEFEWGNDVPRTIRADQNKLRQILINLLGNAVKFTESGGITLSVRRKELGNRRQTDTCFLHFEVVDTGMGISSEEESKIFDTFFQADTSQLSQQGTGLGLPISQKFVDLLGGTLTVESGVGRGTCFTFCIPVELAEVADSDTPQLKRKVIALAENQPNYRLLVVEDNENNRNLLVKLLQSVGFEVQEAVNGQEAIEKWQKWQPHLIWMDMRMPVMDGYEATEIITSKMSQSKCGSDTKIIALTASAFEKDRLKVLTHGANDFVSKPFREFDIFEMVSKYLGVRYVYEVDQVSSKSELGTEKINDKNMTESIKTLPGKAIAMLVEAAELSDVVMIDQVIEDIGYQNKQLANGLSQLAENYAYDKILCRVQNETKKDHCAAE